MPTKVLHIIKSLGRGGAERLLPETISVHNQNEYEFHVIYFLPWKNQMVGDLLKSNAKVTCLAAKNNLQLLLKIPALVTYIKANNIQIVHAHLPWAGIAARLAGKLHKTPVIYTEHNKWERYNKITFWLNKATFSLQQHVVAVSKDVADSIGKFHRQSVPVVSVISNGVNTNTFQRNAADTTVRKQLGIPLHATVVGIVSVFRFQKRLEIWLNLAAALKDKYPNMHFIIVGSGPLESDLHKQSKALQQEGFVHFVGLQSNVQPYYNAMDIFMMTSEFEGLPIALLEAMSMQVIPVCTAAGGIKEVITSKVNGWLSAVENSQDLVNGIDWLMSLSANEKAALQQQVRNHVIQNNSMQTMVTQLEKLYQSFITVK